MKDIEFYPPLDINSCFNQSINDSLLKKFFGYTFKKPENDNYKHLDDDEEDAEIQMNNNNNKHNNHNGENNTRILLENTNKFLNDPLIRMAKTPFPKINHEPSKPIRKLGLIEKIFHGVNDKSRSYIYRTVIISSQINLFDNIGLVNEAIQEWKNVHPLLRCRVIKANSEDKQHSIIKENYFAFATEEKQKSLENVKYLYYKPETNNNKLNYCDDIWKLLLEKETTMPLDGENGLLWRLTFFQIENKKNPSNTNFLFACILTFDHAIMDGRSSYNSLLQLFSIIERMHLKDYRKREKQHHLLPSKEEMFKDRVQSVESLNSNRYYLKAPKFLNITKNGTTNTQPKFELPKHLTQEDVDKGVVYHHDHTPYVSVKELIEISKTNNSKFKALLITKKELERILKKCKENNVKLTTYVNIAVGLALRMMYEKNENKSNQTINYTTNVSLRELPEYKNYAKNYKLAESIGCYIGLSFSSFNEDLKHNEISNPDWVKDFWLKCKQETDTFHENLNKGEFIHSIHLPNKKKEFDEFFYHFGNSNLGVLRSDASSSKLIKVRQAFATGRYAKENFLCWFTNLLATIDGQLCWTISFNSNMIRENVIDELVHNLTKIIRAVNK